MTHTPASGPLAPVTTPPMSEGPIRSCWAPTSLGHAAKNAATLTANNLSYIVRIALMQASFIPLPIGHLMHDLTADHGHVGGDVADRRFRHSERIGAQKPRGQRASQVRANPSCPHRRSDRRRSESRSAAPAHE